MRIERGSVVVRIAWIRRGHDVLDTLARVSLRLYDTATREVRDFDPLEAGKVGIYHCGLTVQARRTSATSARR